MQKLFEAVRRACAAPAWSRGVELTRAEAVVGMSQDEEEIVLKVTAPESVVAATVTLWPDDADWSCDCPGQENVCAHVAAAVIALRQARQVGKTLPISQRIGGRLRYRFSRIQGFLALERLVVRDGQEQPLRHSLSAAAAGRDTGPALLTSQADLQVDLLLAGQPRGRLARDLFPKLLPLLARCPDVMLENTPIKVSATAIGVQVCVEEQGQGFRLFVEPDPTISEMFHNGVARCGDTLRVLVEPNLTAREAAELPQGRYFAPEDVSTLITDILPALKKRLPVDVRTRRLPQLIATPPRAVLDVERDGNALSILPTIVYGDPAVARLDGGRLVHLGGAIPQRDELAERQVLQQLRRILGLTPGYRARFSGMEAIEMASKLATWRGEIRGKAHTSFTLAPALVPRYRLQADQLDVWFEAPAPRGQSTPRRIKAAAVLRAWQRGETLLPLSEGGWAPLPEDWLQQYGQRIADLLAAREASGTLSRYALPDLARLYDALEQPRPPELAHLQVLLEDFAGIPEAPLPEDVHATLRHYQRQGFSWLVFLRQAGLGALLADDMGLGKTLQALCAMQGHTLVVAPTSVLYHWSEEIRRFRPALRQTIYHGPQRRLDARTDVTLTTYAILRLDAALLARQKWATVILDEAQNIKNPDSQVARAAYELQADFRMVLSGTPVENRLDELWSLMHFLNRGLFGGRQDFQERYARPILEGKPAAVEHLRERLRPFLLRRRKSDVVPELPPRTDLLLHCELTPAERQVYDAVRAATLDDVVARLNAGGSILAALEALLRLRQACCHAGLIPGQNATTSAKLELLLETLEEAVAEGHKAIVFSQWTSLLDRVEPHLQRAALAFTRLDGSTRDRARVVKHFQDPGGPPVLLVSLRAGGTGLNLTAADHVFLLDPWWNPAVEEQAADRTHRIGQTRPVFVHRLVARDTVEERILALQERKRALADVALEGAERATAITREELLALLA